MKPPEWVGKKQWNWRHAAEKKNETDGTRLRRGRQFHFFSRRGRQFHCFSRPILDGFIILATLTQKPQPVSFWANETEQKNRNFSPVSRETDHKKKNK